MNQIRSFLNYQKEIGSLLWVEEEGFSTLLKQNTAAMAQSSALVCFVFSDESSESEIDFAKKIKKAAGYSISLQTSSGFKKFFKKQSDKKIICFAFGLAKPEIFEKWTTMTVDKFSVSGFSKNSNSCWLELSSLENLQSSTPMKKKLWELLKSLQGQIVDRTT